LKKESLATGDSKTAEWNALITRNIEHKYMVGSN